MKLQSPLHKFCCLSIALFSFSPIQLCDRHLSAVLYAFLKTAMCKILSTSACQLTFCACVKYTVFVVGNCSPRSIDMRAQFKFWRNAFPTPYIILFFCTLPCSIFLSALSPPHPPFCPLLAMAGWLFMFQATAPVSIPVGPELAGLGSGRGTGPGIGTENGISVSWQSPPVIFKGVPVSEALSHAFLS